MNPKVVLFVEGGVIQTAVCGHRGVEVHVIDRDNRKVGERCYSQANVKIIPFFALDEAINKAIQDDKDL